MFSPIFSVTNRLIKTLAQQYVSGIQIDSLPLWKGEVVLDNVNLNAEGLTETLAKAQSPVRIVNISSTRLSVKLPVFSAGTSPLLVKLHSLDLQLDIGESQASGAAEEAPAQTVAESEGEKQDEKKQSFVARLTSNILIQVDGVVLQLSVMGLKIQLVVSDFQVHIRPDGTEIRGKEVRGRAGNGKLALTLLVDELVIMIKSGEPETIVTIRGLQAKVSDSNGESNTYFDLIANPVSAEIVIGRNSVKVRSESEINLVVSLNILPSVLELIASFPKGAPSESGPPPDLDVVAGPISLRVAVSDSLAAVLVVEKVLAKDGAFQVGPISLRLKLISKEHTLIDGFVLKGTLKQISKTLMVTIESELLKVTAPAQKDLLDILKALKLPKIDVPESEPIAIPKPTFELACSTFRDLPRLSVSSKIVEFAFDDPIIPTGFHFDESIARAKVKLQLRVWEPAFSSFVALVSFESSDILTDFVLTQEQMIPGQRFQLIFPQPLSAFPTFLDASVMHYQTSPSLHNTVSIKANIDDILVSVESYDLPIAVLSVSGVKANAVLGPIGAAKASVSFGVSILLSTFRSETMVNILDIPSIALQIAAFQDVSDSLLALKWEESLTAQSMQESYSANCTSISGRIPVITVNAVPSVVFDLLRYLSTFSMESIISHKVCNNSDVPFFYQVSTDAEHVTVSPGESKNIVFKPGQIHFIMFPAQSVRIVFNEPGRYRLSESAYAYVEMVSPFSFLVTIVATVQFVNKLKTDLEISLESEGQSFNMLLSEGSPKGSNSYILSKDFRLKLRLPDRSDWSDYVDVKHDLKIPQKVECDVLEMLPQPYLCAPCFHCWIVPEVKDVPMMDGQIHQVVEYRFIPILTVVNTLSTHLVTSLGTIPPKSQKFISQLNNRELVFEKQKIDVPFPLGDYVGVANLDGTAVLVTTNPQENSVVFSVKFEVSNESNVPIYVRFQDSTPVNIEPHATVSLPYGRDSNWLLVGVDGSRSEIVWSPPLQPPILRDIVLRTPRGTILLFANFSESKAVIYPKITAVNESLSPIWLKPATKIEPGSQVQLLEWRAKQAVSFGLSRTAEFSEPVSLNDGVLWKRLFIKNDVGQPLNYVTYTVQTNVSPYEIVFHNDPSPPFSIVNSSPTKYDIVYDSHTLVLQKNATLLLPSVPDVFKIGRVGTQPMAVSLQYATELVMSDNGFPVYIKIEKRANQARITISNEKGKADPLRFRLSVSLFLCDLKVHLFDDFTEPGSAKHAMSVTLSPLSVNLLTVPGNSTQLHAALDVLQIDFLNHYERFPVMIQKSRRNTNMLQLDAKLTGTFDKGIIVDDLKVNLQPLEVRVEESHLRFILQLVSLIVVKTEDPQSNTEQGEAAHTTDIHPIYIRSLDIHETEILLSLAIQSFVCTDFSNIPIYLSHLTITNSEQFNVALVQSIAVHYISDVIAAIPSILASFSLIGNPARIISQSMKGISDFYRIAFDSDSILMGLGRGSVSIMRGITMGTLESIVSLSYSLEKSISKLKPFETETEEPAIGSEMVQAVTGVVSLPVREFRQDGLAGMVKGAGMGLLGIVTVPTAAVFTVLKRAGAAALRKVGGKREHEVADTRIEKEPRQLPILRLNDDDD